MRELSFEETAAVSGAGPSTLTEEEDGTLVFTLGSDDRRAQLTAQVPFLDPGFGGSSGWSSPVDLAGRAGISIKYSADIDSLGSDMTDRFDDIADVFAENGVTPVITSGNDSRHGVNSLHFSDLAIDMRANNISDELAAQIASDLRDRLGDDFDIVFESFPKNPSNDHIHIEFDPN